MTVLKILEHPDKRLRIPGEPVTDFGPAFQQLVEDMIETMYTARGVGLAAPQVGEPKNLFVVDAGAGLYVFANPEIKLYELDVRSKEGCLSVPGIQQTRRRSSMVKVRAQDRRGKWFELTEHGLMAIVLQHEEDHLYGTLIIDKPLTKTMLRRIIKEAEREEAAAKERGEDFFSEHRSGHKTFPEET